MVKIYGGKGNIATSEVSIQVGQIILPGLLNIPESFRCTAIFAHGSGSSRHSARNRFVADELNRGGIATLVFDLLSEQEAMFRKNVFDIGLLSQRLLDTTIWATQNLPLGGKGIGYFGASTGAAAALKAASESTIPIGAIVSRGGRPDMAIEYLQRITAPTLLLVGSRDYEVVELNEMAYEKLNCTKKLELVRNATHLFEEEGALEQVADSAKKWFLEYLPSVHITGAEQ